MYFFMVIGFTMFFMHPVYLLISVFGSVSYAVYQSGNKSVRFCVFYMLPMLIFGALVNPAFNHEGATVLTYLPTGNPLTLESILYGISASAMIISVIMWFRCYNNVITSDKFIYLFGRIIPALSLVLSMTMRFVPRFTSQMKTVSESQRSIGRDVSNGSLFSRIHNAVRIISIMITWSLENAVETADSMKSRGYGLPGRTAFSIYQFNEKDKNVLLWLIFCGIYILFGAIAKGMYFRYFPTVKGADFTPLSVSFMLTYLSLCFTPLIINFAEDRKWKQLKSQI